MISATTPSVTRCICFTIKFEVQVRFFLNQQKGGTSNYRKKTMRLFKDLGMMLQTEHVFGILLHFFVEIAVFLFCHSTKKPGFSCEKLRALDLSPAPWKTPKICHP